jgi:putative DNA primase/helicase
MRTTKPSLVERQHKNYRPLVETDFKSIPRELAELRQWVCWGPRGATDKAPIDPNTGRAASTTDSQTWGTLGQAVQRYLTHNQDENLNGIGFVFSSFDPYMGIDLDKCRNAETGEFTPQSEALIHQINSYTESSPSGTGAHIIVRAKIPKSGKKSDIEMYFEKRYFCFTGRVVSASTKIESRQKEVLSLYESVFRKTGDPGPQEKTAHPDALYEAVQNIPDHDLLAVIARNEKHFTDLMQGNIQFLKKDKTPSSADFNLCILFGRYTRLDAARTEHLFRPTALYRQKWDQHDGAYGTYGKRTIAKAFEEIKKKKLSLYDPTNPNGTGPRRLSDGTNTDTFIKMTGNSFAWVQDWNTWLEWNGTYWRRGADLEIMRATRMVSDALWDEWRLNTDYKELRQWAKESDCIGRQRNIERWARYRLNVSSHDLDQHPYLLACKNGVIDLRTGMLREGARQEYLTRGVEWSYLLEAECPQFDRFLEDIMQGSERMIEYLWRVIGYCLTGETAARAFFILYGTGKNGKSTFARALQTLLGMRAENYAQTARFETFLQQARNAGGADPDIAGLAGARMVVASEVNPGEKYRLDGGKIKQFTGEDWMKARFLYSPEFQFLPVCKIFLLVNDVPHIDEVARALYDRLHYISFNYRIPEEKQDGMLHWKLLGEMEGILAKAVRYAGEWYANQTLAPPEEILKAREALAQEMDWLAEFWAERCMVGPGYEVTHAAIYAEYLKWCEENKNKRPMQSQTLSRQLRKRGFKKFTAGHDHKASWEGIGVRDVFAAAPCEPGDDTEVV